MATKVETVENLCGMLAGRWDVRYKKMFGEYMVYVNEKPVLIVCNDTVFITFSISATPNCALKRWKLQSR